MGNAICAALLQISYHLQLSLTTLTKRQPFCLALSECGSILIEWHLNPHFIQHSWCHIKRPCHTFSFCPALTENAHFEVVPMILIFRSECSGYYWVIAKPHASLLFFLFHAHTYTQMHQSAQHGTRWGSLKSQSHTCSPTHRVHTHTHTHTHTLALALTLSLLSRGDFILNWQSQPEEKI